MAASFTYRLTNTSCNDASKLNTNFDDLVDAIDAIPSPPVLTFKTSDQQIGTGSSYVDITGMSVEVAAYTNYKIEMNLYYHYGAAKQILYPADSVHYVLFDNITNFSIGGYYWVVWWIYFMNGPNAGTLKLQAKQNANNPNFKKGCSLLVHTQ